MGMKIDKHKVTPAKAFKLESDFEASVFPLALLKYS
jgi:hypothetical protein